MSLPSDRRLKPARVIGIIFFILSILQFAGLIFGFIPSLFISREREEFLMFLKHPVMNQKDYALQIFNLLFSIPMFFASRALFRFKIWGRTMTIISLMVLMVFFCFYLLSKALFSEGTAILPAILGLIVFLSVLCVPLYFLLRRNTKEALNDFRLQNERKDN